MCYSFGVAMQLFINGCNYDKVIPGDYKKIHDVCCCLYGGFAFKPPPA